MLSFNLGIIRGYKNRGRIFLIRLTAASLQEQRFHCIFAICRTCF